MTFTVSLDNPVDVAVVVDVDYADGGATGAAATGSSGGTGADYDNDQDSVTFNALDTADKTVTVAITDDNIVEAIEKFTASLSTATALGTRLTDLTGTGEGWINNADTATLTIAGVSQDEGSGGGTTSFDFVVTLSNPVQGGVNVTAQTNDGTAIDGTAATGTDKDYTAKDYTPKTEILAFAGTAGETKTFTVEVGADVRYELHETFTVPLSGIAAQGTSVDSGFISAVGSPATGTIQNDDNDIIEAGTDGDDTWTIIASDSNSGTFQVGGGPVIPFTGINSASFSGMGGNDKLVIQNPAGGVFEPVGASMPHRILFEGGAGSDSLELLGGVVDTLGFRYLDIKTSDGFDGYVDYHGSQVITFTGLEPLTNTGTAADIVFSLPSPVGGNTDVLLSNDGTAGMSAIAGSTFEFTRFANPTGSLTINMGTGGDTISVQGLDAGFDANLTINQGAGTDTVTFQTTPTDIGTGNYAIAADTINVDAAVSTSGAVEMNAADDVLFAATGSITATGAGSVLITADADSSGGGAGGALTMADGSSIDAGNGPIALSADEDISLGRVLTTNDTAAAVSVTSTSAGVVDNGDNGGEDIEATAASAVVTVNVVTGFGATGAAVETEITSLSLTSSGAGNVDIIETDGIVLTSLSTADGSIQVAAGGTITATSVQSGGGAGDSVTLHATAGNIVVGSINSADTATLTAGAGSIVDQADDAVADVTAAGLITLTASADINGPGAGDDYLDLAAGSQVDASSTTAGTIRLRGLGNLSGITLTDVDTVDGPINVQAAGTLTATDVESGGGVGDGVTLHATVAVSGWITMAGNILVGSITSADTAVLTADGGAITDNLAGEAANITATKLALRAGRGIGSSAEDVDTQVSTLAVQTQSGDIEIRNVGALTIGAVDGLTGATITNGDGTATGLDNIIITAPSPLTVDNDVVNNDGGEVTLAAEGGAPANDLDVNANVTSAGGNGRIHLYSGDSTDVDGAVTIAAAGTGAVWVSAGTELKLNVGSTISAGGDVILSIGTYHTGGSGSVLGTIHTDGRAVKVTGGEGDDVLRVDLKTATLPTNGLAFDGGNNILAAPADTLLIEADDDSTRDILCISDTAGRINWREGVSDATPVHFKYENTETLDLQTKGGDDQVTFSMDEIRRTVVKLNAGADSGSPGALLDGLRVIGTNGGDDVFVGISGSGRRFEINDVESLQIFGRAGNDTVLNDTGVPSLIDGGDGDDTLTGGSAPDVIFGGDGRDSILAGAGDDFLFPDNVLRSSPETSTVVVPVVPNEYIDGGAGSNDRAVSFGDTVTGVEGGPIEGGKIDIVMWLIGNLPRPTDESVLAELEDAFDSSVVASFVACPAAPATPLGVSPSPLSGVSATPLGTVAFEQLGGLDVSSGELWYSLETSHLGYLTIQAAFDASSGQLQMALYDADENLLLVSTANDTGARLDWQVKPSETYYAKLVGTSNNFDLTLVNLLDHQGTDVTVDGTAGDDTFTFDASASRLVAVNGVEYEFDDGDVATVTFAGNDGTDTLSLFDSPGDDSFVAGPDSVTFADQAGSFSVAAGGMEIVHAYARAGGHDSAELHGSENSDKFKSVPDDGYAKMYGGSVYLRAKFFETVDAYSMGGNDLARMFGSSGHDTFEGRKDSSRFYGGTFDVTAHDFSQVLAHAGQGGNDVAKLTDSVLKDELHAKAHKTELFDMLTKGSVYKITARGFDSVHAQASEGGFDKAKLWDTPADDLVEASGDGVRLSTMRGELEMLYEVLAFELVKARGFGGGNNTSNVVEPVAVDLDLEGTWDQ